MSIKQKLMITALYIEEVIELNLNSAQNEEIWKLLELQNMMNK
jgi:hypothetical protein